jgi:hypothetical protein
VEATQTLIWVGPATLIIILVFIWGLAHLDDTEEIELRIRSLVQIRIKKHKRKPPKGDGN